MRQNGIDLILTSRQPKWMREMDLENTQKYMKSLFHSRNAILLNIS